MKKQFIRMIALCLCLCLLPVWALAQEQAPVTRADFEVSFHLDPAAFVNDGAAHYRDWADFLSKLSIRGEADSQLFLDPMCRTYVNGGLYVKEREVMPFTYDNYYTSYRYLRSPAFAGASIHFQFRNFFQFMLKGYYYMDLPTQLIALLLYPEAGVAVYRKYQEPLEAFFAGEGGRSYSYDELYELCQQLDMIILDDAFSATESFFTCLLIDLYASDMVLEKLGCLEGWLDHLDPEGEGLTIAVDGESETWTIGQTTVLTKAVQDGETVYTVYLPDEYGYEYTYVHRSSENAVSMNLAVVLEGEERLNALLEMDGYADPLHAAGDVRLTVNGAALEEEMAPITLRYSKQHSADTLPHDLVFTLDWVNPATDMPAIGLTYTAALREQTPDVLAEKRYDNQDDFFHLNESFLEEYKQRFLPTLALTALPILLEMPAGIISDVVPFLEETGLLAFMGIE